MQLINQAKREVKLLGQFRVSVTEDRAVSVEWPLLKKRLVWVKEKVFLTGTRRSASKLLSEGSLAGSAEGRPGDSFPLESITQNAAAQVRTITSLQFFGPYTIRE